MSRASVLILLVACRIPPVKLDTEGSDGGHETGLIGRDDTDSGEISEDACFSADAPWLSTTTGCVTGAPFAYGEAFLGLPYARPPTGARRFLPPEPVTPWSLPLAAETLGEPCLQTYDSADGAHLAGEGDEDCLTLNVWRPEDAAGLPLVFFVHGGNFLNGSGGVPDLALDPSLARDAVVVTHNARLGPFGYLAHPGLSAASKAGVSGNQGVLDTLLALRWAHDNAEALGADPDRVLLVGQESGGLVACTLLFSPLSEGLFDAVMLQSAPCGLLQRPLSDIDPSSAFRSAEDAGEALADALSCTGTDAEEVACLQDRPASGVLEMLSARPAPLMEGVPWEPTVDGYVLPDTPQALLAAGSLRQVPIFAGVNADEGSLYADEIGADEISEFTMFLAFSKLMEEAGADPDGLSDEVYTSARYGSPSAAFIAFYGDFVHTCPTRSFLRAASQLNQDVYAYTFTHTPSFTSPELGAFTGAELPFLFGTRADAYQGSEALISAWLQSAWLWSLDAPPMVIGVGEWPDFEGEDWVLFGDASDPGTDDDPYEDVCDAIDLTGWQVY